MRQFLFIVLPFLMLLVVQANAQQPVNPAGEPSKTFGPSLTPGASAQTDSVMVTIVLKHQQDKNLAEIRRKLENQGFWDLFPPSDTRVISWTIAMGYGHIITLMAPANSVRRLNLALENGAWGAFDTEIYLTYDYKPVWQDYLEMKQEARDDRD